MRLGPGRVASGIPRFGCWAEVDIQRSRRQLANGKISRFKRPRAVCPCALCTFTTGQGHVSRRWLAQLGGLPIRRIAIGVVERMAACHRAVMREGKLLRQHPHSNFMPLQEAINVARRGRCLPQVLKCVVMMSPIHRCGPLTQTLTPSSGFSKICSVCTPMSPKVVNHLV